MNWKDEGFLLSKNNYNENSIIIEAFTLEHGKYTGIVYGGSSSKQKRIFQVGNKILINWITKGENRPGYFNVELIKPISPIFFDDKKKSSSIRAATSILKILLPERQVNEKIYKSYEDLINEFETENWIKSYIYWELSLIKDLGFETNYLSEENYSDNKIIKLNNMSFKIPKMFFKNYSKAITNEDVKEALVFNKNLLLENFIIPNRLSFPLFRNIFENYFN